MYDDEFRDEAVIVPMLTGINDNEAAAVTSRYQCLELYKTGVASDKRCTAAFSAIAANDMKGEVFGLVGGRSGSMDIVCFMGVNTVSWDEPIFQS